MSEKLRIERKQIKTVRAGLTEIDATQRHRQNAIFQEKVDKKSVEVNTCGTCGSKYKRVKHSSMSHCSKRCYFKSLEG
jgi:hypothetical protein